MPNDIPDWTQSVSLAAGTIDISTSSIAVGNLTGGSLNVTIDSITAGSVPISVPAGTTLSVTPQPLTVTTLSGSGSYVGGGSGIQTIGTISLSVAIKVARIQLVLTVSVPATGSSTAITNLELTDGTHTVVLCTASSTATASNTALPGVIDLVWNPSFIPAELATTGTLTLQVNALTGQNSTWAAQMQYYF